MFKSWCAAQKFNNATNLSHVLMDGGVLSVPFDKLRQFHEKYIEAVKRGEKLYVVEQKSEKYNFFVDIDYKAETALELNEIKDICKIICDKVKRHGGKDCLISVSPPKDTGGLVKTGVHLNWPGMVVDQSSAIALRDHILVSLSKGKGSKIDWDDIIDSSVYGNMRRNVKGSGFRMPWSYKKAKHTSCQGRGCSGCEKGKVDQLAYLPIFIYKHGPLSTILQISQDPTLEILEMAAVRTDLPQTVHVEPPSTVIREGTFTAEQTKDELQNDELKSKVEHFIRTHMEGQSGSYVPKIFKKKDTYLVKTTSKYCENIKREHGSNHVWFIISGQSILQKCFCVCETLVGRRDGFCKDFCGRRHQLPRDIVELLYPNKEEIKKCPEIKKRVEKPVVKCGVIKEPLEMFITKHMKAPEGTSVVKLTKNKTGYTVQTTSNYCEVIKNTHDDVVMSYVIKGKEIKQKCPICKRGVVRTHVLTPNVLKILKRE